MNLSPIQSNSTAPTPGPAPIPPQQAAERRDLVKAADVINASETFGSENELVFVFDRTTHRPIMRVVDRNTNDVIMQLPPDYVLNLAAQVQEQEKRRAAFAPQEADG